MRTDAVTGLTIHHTCSHSPLALARWSTQNKGVPSIQYHWWVSQEDGCPIYLLAKPEWQIIHDHTGLYQTTLSIGMAGRLDRVRPPDEQLRAVAQLCAYLIKEYHLPSVETVRGHCERAAENGARTICPGWDATDWRDDFYAILSDSPRGDCRDAN